MGNGFVKLDEISFLVLGKSGDEGLNDRREVWAQMACRTCFLGEVCKGRDGVSLGVLVVVQRDREELQR